MNTPNQKDESKTFAEESDSLWFLTIAPTTWALHFVLSYAATSIVCLKTDAGPEAIALLQTGIGILTLVAISAIAFIGWRSWRQWDYPDDHDYAHDSATQEDRHEFLGHAAFLLSVISFIGVVYVAMPPFLTASCS